ncbi:MFP1 attachment factor 1-like [Gossypium australe]|uniref:MFP1 attachment factor 1-like n=1 Tax=Gossypium australe TaxID=47621 RepID=A0A5B6X0V4_9ROSI|nr:MFP1 attachment factor 1-like [Gossypium australe]
MIDPESPIAKDFAPTREPHQTQTQEASTTAKLIEEETFLVTDASFSTDKENIKILRLYSKEISKHILDIVKVGDTIGIDSTFLGSIESAEESHAR